MIHVESLSKSYPGGVVLEDIHLVIPENQTLAIVGPSGSGKTTLLRLIAGLESLDSGRILIDGVVASAVDVHLAPHQRKLGFVFQFPTLWPHLTAYQNITFGLNHHRNPADRERALELIEAMQLTSILKRYPHQLSGGEARRVSLARTLVCRPKYLLLDEPLTHLNVELKETLRPYILEFARQNGCGLVWVTHDLQEAHLVSEQIYRLENRHLVAEEVKPCL